MVGVATPPLPLEGEHPFQVEAREDGLTLSLDVPHTTEPGRTYEAMARAGAQLSERVAHVTKTHKKATAAA